jgi:NAD(P)-dependent dehydrogenase (short-subunit alcohol dehydrogenase family)
MNENKPTSPKVRLEGKVAVITGANSGIGLAAAKLFASEGAFVFLVGRRQKELDEAVKEIGENALAVKADVSNMRDLDKLYEVVREKFTAIDIVYANAGGGDFMRLGDITEEQYDRIFSINVKGTLFTVQKALPLLRDGGSVILTGSTAATTGIPAFSMYGGSKAAIRSFARTWILDLAPRKIRVNVIVPGSTSTPGWHSLSATEEQNKKMQEMAKAGIPLGRMAAPEEIAHAALFLASAESSFVNGSELFVDGGSAQI